MIRPLIISSLMIAAAFSAAIIQEKSDLVKITAKRIPMDPRLLTLCVGPDAIVGPHTSAEVDIYVNSAVIDYRRRNPDKFTYPIGSKFVKQKYSKVGDKEPDIATIMVKKQDTGTIDDWEFTMESLPDHKPIIPTGSVSCASCHEHYEERGFISSQSEKELRMFLQKANKGQ